MRKSAALLKAATELEREASNLRLQAQRSAEADKRHRNLEKARHALLQRLREGFRDTPEKLAQDLARDFRVPPETVAHWLHRAMIEAKTAARKIRDRHICKLARAGKTNEQIGKLVGLHHKTVQRIVTRDLLSLLRQLHRNNQQRPYKGQLQNGGTGGTGLDNNRLRRRRRRATIPPIIDAYPGS